MVCDEGKPTAAAAEQNKRNLLELWATQQIDNRKYTSYLAWEADRERVMDVYLAQAKTMADVVYLREFLRNAGKAVAQHLTRIHEQRVQDLETQVEMLNMTNHTFAEERRFLLNAQDGLKSKFAADKADLVNRLETATAHVMEQRRLLEAVAARNSSVHLPALPPELEGLKREQEAPTGGSGRLRAGNASPTSLEVEAVMSMPRSSSRGAVIGRVSEEGEIRELRVALKASEAEKRQLQERFDRDVGMLRAAIEQVESERAAMAMRAEDLDQRRARAEHEALRLKAEMEKAGAGGAGGGSAWSFLGAARSPSPSPAAGASGAEELRAMRQRVAEARREVQTLEEMAHTLSGELERLVSERADAALAVAAMRRDAAALAYAIGEHAAEDERLRAELQTARAEREELARRAELLTGQAEAALQAAMSQAGELGERAAHLASGSARRGKREAELMKQVGQLREELEHARGAQAGAERKLAAMVHAHGEVEASERAAREVQWRLEEEGRELNRHLLAVNKEAEVLKEALRSAELARDAADAERAALRAQLRAAGIAPAAAAAARAPPRARRRRSPWRTPRPTARAASCAPCGPPPADPRRGPPQRRRERPLRGPKRQRDPELESPRGGRGAAALESPARRTPPRLPRPAPQADAAPAAAPALAAAPTVDEAVRAALEAELARLREELERMRAEAALAAEAAAAAAEAAAALPEAELEAAAAAEAAAEAEGGARGGPVSPALEAALPTGPEQELSLEVAQLKDRVAELLEDRDGYMREIESLEDGLVDRDLKLAEIQAMSDATINGLNAQVAVLKARVAQLEAVLPASARSGPPEDPRSPSQSRTPARKAAGAARPPAGPGDAKPTRTSLTGRTPVVGASAPAGRPLPVAGGALRRQGALRRARGLLPGGSPARGRSPRPAPLSSDSLDALLDIVHGGSSSEMPLGEPVRCESPTLPAREEAEACSPALQGALAPPLSASASALDASPLASPSRAPLSYPASPILSEEQRAAAPPTRLRLPASRRL
eukprot:tig00021617_g22950.t1